MARSPSSELADKHHPYPRQPRTLPSRPMIPATTQGTPPLETHVFETIAKLTRELAGISMNETKIELVRSRLGKRLREHGLTDFSSYLELIRRDEVELSSMIDALTTNKTSF